MNSLDYLEIVQLFSDEELEDEYGWHRTRAKEHRRNHRYGLYWWHQKHAHVICDEIGRRAMYEPGPTYEQLSIMDPIFRNIAPEERGK